MAEEYFEAMKIGVISPNKKEMANIMISIAEWIKELGNKEVQIDLKISLKKSKGDC